MEFKGERFGCNNLLKGFKFMKNVVKIAMDIWWNNTRKEMCIKKKNSKQYIQRSYFWKYITLLSRDVWNLLGFLGI